MGDELWYLIEAGNPAIYFCDPDWCSNANHAKKYATAEEAQPIADAMMVRVPSVPLRVVCHSWGD
jgi:hypothetical protein